ncbi:hypothetical protein CDCA_CDCA10G3077 [Cyanidium caldarium]|uniref:very-long-chain (3R)-3-hydroxyacyl-CoA dehydratase n=1 Tax=Cyanidium caldarium TaxID=2771 RepID=A0AAV9IXP4_CYACA|nr:hypothetical protein CDCA_CDCA10G3077 [Cyanidium caldarium]
MPAGKALEYNLGRQRYLFVYNLGLCAGWTFICASILFVIGQSAVAAAGATADRAWLTAARTLGQWTLIPPPLRRWLCPEWTDWADPWERLAWQVTFRAVQCFQTAALLELLHAALVWVRASVLVTGMQIASRVFVVWFMLTPFARELSADGYTTLVLTWSLTETVRYAYFAVQTYAAMWMPNVRGGGSAAAVPHWLSWLRYSTFVVLYPLGVSCEMWSVWCALPLIRRSGFLRVRMPNAWNVAFDLEWLCYAVLCGYPPGLWRMYTHMLRQRTRHLGARRQREVLNEAASKTRGASTEASKAKRA